MLIISSSAIIEWRCEEKGRRVNK